MGKSLWSEACLRCSWMDQGGKHDVCIVRQRDKDDKRLLKKELLPMTRVQTTFFILNAMIGMPAPLRKHPELLLKRTQHPQKSQDSLPINLEQTLRSHETWTGPILSSAGAKA